MITEIASKNFKKMRSVARKVVALLTKKQLAIVCIVLTAVLCFLGWFQFGPFLKGLIYMVLFAIAVGQLAMFIFVHGVKHTKDSDTISQEVEPETPPEEVVEVHREYRRRRHPDVV